MGAGLAEEESLSHVPVTTKEKEQRSALLT